MKKLIKPAMRWECLVADIDDAERAAGEIEAEIEAVIGRLSRSVKAAELRDRLNEALNQAHRLSVAIRDCGIAASELEKTA